MALLKEAAINRRAFCSGTISIGMATLALPSRLLAAQDDALRLMQASYQTTRFANARFSASLAMVSAGRGSQRRNLNGVAKLVGQGAQARMIRFSSPSDMTGVATLTIERGASADDLWIYLPAMHRVRRLVTANRADPWVGSDFSFGDILGHKVSDWTHRLAGMEHLGDGDAWRIDSMPASQAVVRETGYGWRRSWVRKSDNALLRCDFYTPGGEVLKSAVFSDLRVLDERNGKIQPMVMAVHNARRSTTSILRFTQFVIDQSVPASEVAPEALTR